jgi:hypothetical protein
MARILHFDDRTWHNWHFTERDVPIAGRFELHRRAAASLAEMRASAAAVQGLIGRAFAERRRLRAHGSTWSFSAAPSIPGGWPLATGYANQLFALPDSHVRAEFAGDHHGLVLCQTGISVAELNMWLEPRGRSLSSSGASNGQTFVGAMSCSTHGSAIDHPAIQSHVRAIQLIPSPTENLWIEPASAPVTDGRLAADLGATVVRDDRLFAAALVSLGALGVIHAVLLESVPRFLLESHRQRVPASPALLAAMTSLGDADFAAADLPGSGGRRPYFFQSVINDHIDKGFAYVTCGYRRDWDTAHDLDYRIRPRRSAGYNLATVVANLLDAAPGLTPIITKAVLADQLSPINGRVGSWGQSFNFTTPRAGTAGASVAAPASHVHDVLGIFHAALKKVGKAPVAFACRYARRSPGWLAFIRWSDSVIVDIDGLDNGAARAVMAQAVADLRSAGIPHAEHWGKLNQMTATSVRDAYGDALESWLAARSDLLDREGEYVFGSPWLDSLGLSNRTF